MRTVVAVFDPRYLRALARVLATEDAVTLCGFAGDADTAATIARVMEAELLLLDARLHGIATADWPIAARRVLLVEDGQACRPPGKGIDAQLSAERLACELPGLIGRLFP